MNAVFSPDERYIACGRSAEGKGNRGALVILQRDTLEVERNIECEPGVSVVRVVWHSKINQVSDDSSYGSDPCVMGEVLRKYLAPSQIVTGLSNGQIKVLYSPDASLNGAKLLLTKSAKKVTIEDASRAFLSQPIITPHALPMFREDNPMAALQSGREGRVGKRKREKERMDKSKTQRPDAPLSGPGRGGRVGASATQHVVQNLVRDSTRDEDVGIFFFFISYFAFCFSFFCIFPLPFTPPRETCCGEPELNGRVSGVLGNICVRDPAHPALRFRRALSPSLLFLLC